MKLREFAALALTSFVMGIVLSLGSQYRFGILRLPDIQGSMQKCYKETKKSQCYRDMAIRLLTTFALGDIMKSFDRTQNTTEMFSDCHEVAHYLGREAYRKSGNAGESFAGCTHACLNGCYHGVVEGYFQERKVTAAGLDDERIRKEITSFCGKRDAAAPFIYRECYHGIGHALMLLTDMELPRSLALCDRLEKEEFLENTNCYDGAFMENAASVTNPYHTSRYLKGDDMLYPCNILEVRYQPFCYGYQALYYLRLTDGNWNRVIAMCMKVPVPYQPHCMEQIGENIAGSTQDNKERKALCDLVGDQFLKTICTWGVAKALGGRSIGDASSMIAFCSLSEGAIRIRCFEELALAIHNWGYTRELRATICNTLPNPADIPHCMKEIPSGVSWLAW